MPDELIKETKPNFITLGGEEYKLAPLNLNFLANIEEEFNCNLEDIDEILSQKRIWALRKLLYILLKDDYPDLTREKIGKLVELNQLGEISEAVKRAITEV